MAGAPPLNVFYPGCSVNLTIRFDEALLKDTSQSQPVATSAAQGANDAVVPPNGASQGTPGIFQDADRPLSRRLCIVPTKATAELTGFRQAWKFSLTFLYRDFPIDPRTVRAVGVEIFLGTVTGDQWSRGMRGERDYGNLASLVAASPDNRVMFGVVDVIREKFTENGSEVEMEGRGLQALLLDLPVSADMLRNLKTGDNIQTVVSKILQAVKLADKLDVHYEDPNVDSVGKVYSIPKVFDLELAPRNLLTADAKEVKRAVKGEAPSQSCWDLIVHYCFLVGVLPDFDGQAIRLRPVINLFDRKLLGLQGQSPFNPPGTSKGAPREVNGEKLSYRRMVYGRNLLNFTMERKLGGAAKIPVIRCISTVLDNPDLKGKNSVIEVFWPPQKGASVAGVDTSKLAAAVGTNPAPNDLVMQTNILTIPIKGVKDKEQLSRAARAVYEEISRGELTGSASTKDLTSFGGNNEDADLLRLRPSEPVQFAVDSSGTGTLPPIVSELTRLASMAPEQAIAEVASRLNGDQILARVLVGTARGSIEGLQDTFRVGNVKFTWDVTTGIAVDFDFQNYVESRQDVTDGKAVTVQLGELTLTPNSTAAASKQIPVITVSGPKYVAEPQDFNPVVGGGVGS